jgi:hypothetical protein
MIDALMIEKYASQIAESAGEMYDANGKVGIMLDEPTIDHLSDAELDMVMDRAAEIARERGEAALAEADALKNLRRLAHAAGMPDGGKPIPWLVERGLIEKFGDGWRFKTAKPEANDPDDDIPF